MRLLERIGKAMLVGALLICCSAAAQDKSPPPSTTGGSIPDKPQGNKKYLQISGKVRRPIGIQTPEPAQEQAQCAQPKYRGTVVLNIGISETGTVDWVRVVRSLNKVLDQKAVAAVARWTFDPATKDGVLVAVQVNVEVNFRDC